MDGESLLRLPIAIALTSAILVLARCSPMPSNEELQKALVGEYELVQAADAAGGSSRVVYDRLFLRAGGKYDQESLHSSGEAYRATGNSWRVIGKDVALSNWKDLTGVLSPDGAAGERKEIVVPVEEASPRLIVLSSDRNVFYRPRGR